MTSTKQVCLHSFSPSVYKKHDNEDLDDAKFLSFIDSRNDDGYLEIEITPEIVRQVLVRMDLSRGMSSEKLCRFDMPSACNNLQ